MKKTALFITFALIPFFLILSCDKKDKDNNDEKEDVGGSVGLKENKYISSLKMTTYNGVSTFSFQYDENGRCKEVIRKDGGEEYYRIVYSYDGNKIVASWNGGSEEMTTDSQGRLISYSGTDNFGVWRSRTISYSSNNTVVIDISTDYYASQRTLSYTDGNLTKQYCVWEEDYGKSTEEITYSYIDYPDDYSIDFTHYLLDHMGASLILPPFLAFPALRNKHLLKTPIPAWIDEDHETPISYSFDDKGRVTKAKWSSKTTSSFFEFDIAYRN